VLKVFIVIIGCLSRVLITCTFLEMFVCRYHCWLNVLRTNICVREAFSNSPMQLVVGLGYLSGGSISFQLSCTCNTLD
jgi:hypothetical protein